MFEVNMTYEPYSREPEYIESNRSFVRSIGLSSARRLLDLACGTGVIAELALEVNPRLGIVGLDISHESLLLARERFEAMGAAGDGTPSMVLLQGDACHLPLERGSVDAVIVGNAIHMLPDRQQLLSEIHRVLEPGGVFAFNGSFYAGTMVIGTERFYHEWVKQALLYVMARDRALREQGLEGIPRRRGEVSPAFSQPWPSVHDWAADLRHQGFILCRSNQRTVSMTQHSFESIGAYAGLARVLLSGYPVAVASEALQAAAGPALAAVNMVTVPRNWLEIVAIRRPDAVG